MSSRNNSGNVIDESKLRNLYQDVLFTYVHLWKLSTCDVVPILPALETRGVIDSEERAMIDKQQASVDKILVLFKQIMPTKFLLYHYILIEILKERKQVDLANLLESKFIELGLVPRKSTAFHRSRSRSRTISNSNNTGSQSVFYDSDFYEEQDAEEESIGSESTGIMKPSDFANEKYLGQGTYGKVYAAMNKRTRKQVAIKKLSASQNNEDGWQHEVDVLRQASHPHIISIIGIVENLEVEEVWIVTELMDGGSLRPYCTGSKRHELQVDQKSEVSLQCWSALAYLHDVAKITHKDIKPENLLVHHTPDGKLTAKLCDFGLAEIKSTLTVTEETKLGGTWMYYPPEFSEAKRNPRKADVYSLGATLCELFTSLYFWHVVGTGQRMEDCQILFKLVTVFQSVNSGSVGKERYGPGALALESVDLPDATREILRSTVHFDRHLRPDASEVLGKLQGVSI